MMDCRGVKTLYENITKITKNKKYLLICEGSSALNGVMPCFGRENCGYFTLRGKPLNVWTASSQKFTANKELSSLYQIVRNADYEKIVFASDQDLDGFHIRALLSGFFEKYLPEYKALEPCHHLETSAAKVELQDAKLQLTDRS